MTTAAAFLDQVIEVGFGLLECPVHVDRFKLNLRVSHGVPVQGIDQPAHAPGCLGHPVCALKRLGKVPFLSLSSMRVAKVSIEAAGDLRS